MTAYYCGLILESPEEKITRLEEERKVAFQKEKALQDEIDRFYKEQKPRTLADVQRELFPPRTPRPPRPVPTKTRAYNFRGFGM